MRIRLIMAAVLGWVGVALGASPTTVESPGKQLSATVSEVVGMVEVRDDETGAWREAKAEMVLPVGAECRTGPKSSITMTMPPAQVIKLDRLGTVKILEAFEKGGKLKTDLGMKYGRVRYHQEAAGLEHESVIRSPSSALAVRGSDVEKTDYALMAEVRVYEGLAERDGGRNKKVTLGTGTEDSYVGRPVELGEGDLTPAGHAADQAAAPYAGGAALTDEEREVAGNVNNATGMGLGVRPLQDVQRPAPVQPRFPTAVGSLVFDLHWIGDGSSGVTPDLNLFVMSPKQEKLGAGGTAGSGGVMSVNDRGGAGRASGHEFAQWEKSYPLGSYTYEVKYMGNGDPATYGKQIIGDFVDTVLLGGSVVTFMVKVAGKGVAAGKKGR
ncbi:MAG: hypothetical protein NTU53_02355 [Planctomycetota bacterium]|nr:hypothetical protein [Planctomycetota bacterium]